jgi:hypothetical protein
MSRTPTLNNFDHTQYIWPIACRQSTGIRTASSSAAAAVGTGLTVRRRTVGGDIGGGADDGGDDEGLREVKTAGNVRPEGR